MLRDEKISLRALYKAARSSVPYRADKDAAIAKKVIGHDEVNNARLVLCYLSIDDEVDTINIIKGLMEMGKKIALPRCGAERGIMSFYYYKSQDELIRGRYGLLEPNPEVCEIVEDFSQSVCIVPALAIDKGGYRLGYGGGYYDRFLPSYPCKRIGIVYDICFTESLPHGRFDIPMNHVITESQIVNI